MKDKRFGKFIVKEFNGRDKYGKLTWLCQCDCGIIKSVREYSLVKGLSKSCGCSKKQRNDLIKDLSGSRYGRLVVLYNTTKRSNDGQVIWKCQCDCGNFIEVMTCNLGKSTNSCGCKHKKILVVKIVIFGKVE